MQSFPSLRPGFIAVHHIWQLAGILRLVVLHAQVVIARETAAQLSLGTNIANAKGLPGLPADGKVPSDLGQKYGAMILAADGFAEVGGPELPAGKPLAAAMIRSHASCHDMQSCQLP